MAYTSFFFFFFNTLRSFTSSSIPLSQLPLLGPDQLNFSNLNASFIYSWKCPPTSSFPSHPPKKYTHRYTLQFNLFSMATHWPHPLYISVFSHGPRFLQSAPCSSPHPQSFLLIRPLAAVKQRTRDGGCSVAQRNVPESTYKASPNLGLRI